MTMTRLEVAVRLAAGIVAHPKFGSGSRKKLNLTWLFDAAEELLMEEQSREARDVRTYKDERAKQVAQHTAQQAAKSK